MGKLHLAIGITPSLLAELNQYDEQLGTSKKDVVVIAISKPPSAVRSIPGLC
jgi:alpha-amylase/alpha-mannosidase (GH57 family)